MGYDFPSYRVPVDCTTVALFNHQTFWFLCFRSATFIGTCTMMKLLPALLIGLIAFTFATAGTNTEPEKSAPKAKLPQPVVNTHELMEIFNEDLHDTLKEKMAQEPKTAREWKLLKRQGYRAAEIANLVSMREAEGGDEKLWQELSNEAQQAGINLAEAAKKKDWAATKTAYQGLIQNCNTCHQKTDPAHAPKIEP